MIVQHIGQVEVHWILLNDFLARAGAVHATVSIVLYHFSLHYTGAGDTAHLLTPAECHTVTTEHFVKPRDCAKLMEKTHIIDIQ